MGHGQGAMKIGAWSSDSANGAFAIGSGPVRDATQLMSTETTTSSANHGLDQDGNKMVMIGSDNTTTMDET